MVYSPELEAVRKKYQKGMRGLGSGLIALGVLQLILGLAMVAIGEPFLGIIVLPLAAINITFGVFARVQQLWVNYAVIVFASLLLVLNCAGMAIANKDPDPNKPPAGGGACCSFLILFAMIYTAANNLQTYSKVRGLEQDLPPSSESTPEEPPAS
jgi:hypothetical protein